MAIYNFQDLRNHIGHDIRCVGYGEVEPYHLWTVAIECKECGVVLVDLHEDERIVKSLTQG